MNKSLVISLFVGLIVHVFGLLLPVFSYAQIGTNNITVESFNNSNDSIIGIHQLNDSLQAMLLKYGFAFEYTDSSYTEYTIVKNGCKNAEIRIKHGEKKVVPVILVSQQLPNKEFEQPFMIHGDINYDYSYHSFLDSSYPGIGFNQHQVIVNIYTRVLKKYPVIIRTAALQTNIPYIKNYIDLSIQFDYQAYNEAKRKEMKRKLLDQLNKEIRHDSILYNSILNQYKVKNNLNNWLNSDKQLKQFITSAQLLKQYADYTRRSGLSDSNTVSQFSSDTTYTSYLQNLTSLQKEINTTNPGLSQALQLNSKIEDSLLKKIPGTTIKEALVNVTEYISKYSELKKINKNKMLLEKQFDSSRSFTQLNKDSIDLLLNQGNIAALEKKFPELNKDLKNYKQTMALKQFSIGKSYADYSQLSVKNMLITGINAEYVNRYYVALAAGIIDYRYFGYLPNDASKQRYLLLGRFGWGPREGKHLHFTAYTGSKQIPYYTTNNTASFYNITGLTVETKIPLNKYSYLTCEVAKSTYPSISGSGTKNGNLFGFSDRENEAYSLELFTYLKATETRIMAVYNQIGAYFQSFNLYNNSNSNTSSWQIKADQYLFKKRLSISGSVKKNDYSTPYAVNNYHGQTMFYSFQASLRLKKWPVITIGYLPFSQMTLLNNQFIENRFYTLLGSLNYAYKYKKTIMNTSFVYTQYFNSSNQIGFVFYNTQNAFFNHTIFLGAFNVTAAATLTTGNGNKLYTVGSSTRWQLSKSVTAGVGLKYNSLNNINSMWGYNSSLEFTIHHIGRVGCSYERGYLPGNSNMLITNEWGRLVYTKTF